MREPSAEVAPSDITIRLCGSPVPTATREMPAAVAVITT